MSDKPVSYINLIDPDVFYPAIKAEWDDIPRRHLWRLKNQINSLWPTRHDPDHRRYLRMLITRAKGLIHE